MTYKPFTFVDQTLNALQRPNDDMIMIAKPTVAVGDEEFVADLVLQMPGPQVVVVEYHDCPYPGPGSGRRDRLLREANVPVLRYTSEQMAKPGFPDLLRHEADVAILRKKPVFSVN